MKRRNKAFVFVFGIIFASTLLGVLPREVTEEPVRHSEGVLAMIDVSASIGAAPVSYTLFGYTSALTTVKLEGVGVHEETNARKDGYYEFTNFFAPRDSNEFCLTPIDTEQHMGAPLCIVAPTDVQGKRFGPYLLAPTIVVTEGETQTGESNTVSGKTIPGTSVVVNVFENPDRQILSLVPPVYAQENRKIITSSSSDGTFTTHISSDKPGKVKLFAQSTYMEQKTPKSNTLTISIVSLWLAFLALFFNLFRNLLTLNTFIAIQLFVLGFIVYRKLFIHPLYQRKKRELAIRAKHLPMVESSRAIEKLPDYCDIWDFER